MANKKGQKVERSRDIEMPTRQRLLSIVKILRDYDEDHPIKRIDLYTLLYFEYCVYILSETDKELAAANSADKSEAAKIISNLKDKTREMLRSTEKTIDTSKSSAKATAPRRKKRAAVDEMAPVEQYGRLIEIAEAAAFKSKREKYAKKLIDALRQIKDDEIVSCASFATLAEDMRVLMDADYAFAASTGSRGISPSARGVYGCFDWNKPDRARGKEAFSISSAGNSGSGEDVDVLVRWDFDALPQQTPLFDVFGYENIALGPAPDQFIIKTRDDLGLYLNLLRLGPVIEVLGPAPVRAQYADKVRQMYEKHQLNS